MKNKKFTLLMMEFTHLVKGSSLSLDEHQALLCRFGELKCRIEDGVRVGLTNTILIMIALDIECFPSEAALRINANLSLTAGGYIAKFKSDDYFYVRGMPLPDHPQGLLKILSDTVIIANTLRQELNLHVVI
ncbi:hypothetical protein [Shewanella sp. WE21]|jgi:hypothetical protein|uniref:hypothetical protein n=1 Tax=Shewanella sp. WE21 TaxID=2029986 RepID=UPI0020B11941|nr:hypothetical protein [Shewanella sp. WE21]